MRGIPFKTSVESAPHKATFPPDASEARKVLIRNAALNADYWKKEYFDERWPDKKDTWITIHQELVLNNKHQFERDYGSCIPIKTEGHIALGLNFGGSKSYGYDPNDRIGSKPNKGETAGFIWPLRNNPADKIDPVPPVSLQFKRQTLHNRVTDKVCEVLIQLGKPSMAMEKREELRKGIDSGMCMSIFLAWCGIHRALDIAGCFSFDNWHRCIVDYGSYLDGFWLFRNKRRHLEPGFFPSSYVQDPRVINLDDALNSYPSQLFRILTVNYQTKHGSVNFNYRKRKRILDSLDEFY